MFAELSTYSASAMSPVTTCSVMEFTTNSKANRSPVRVMDFNRCDKPKTAMVVIPKCLLPDLRNESLSSVLAKGVAITNNTDSATFSCTEDDSSVSSISTEDCPTSRRAIFSPYWKKSGEQPLALIPTGAPEEEEVVAIRRSASSVQSWPGYEIQELRRQAPKPRLIKSDPSLVRPMPPSILRKPKYSGKGKSSRRAKSDLSATSIAIAGALATIEAESMPSPTSGTGSRVKFNAKVDVCLFSKDRPMEEKAHPGWSKMFAC